MTDLLSELERLSKEATPGEWRYTCAYGVAFIEAGSKKSIASAVEYLKTHDADLIVEMRNNLDKLLAVARAAEEMYVGVMTENWPIESQMKMRDVLNQLKGGK